MALPGQTAAEPPRLAPMLAGGSGVPADADAYLFEPKWDGVRIISTIHEGNLTLASRNGRDVTAGYPDLRDLPRALSGRSSVVDGEVVAFDDAGHPSFQRLQRRMHVRNPPSKLLAEVHVAHLVFDVLWLDGELLVDLPQVERRRRLDELGIQSHTWHTSPVLDAVPDEDLLEICRKIGLEGYVGKRKDATYLPGRRSPAWVKVKCTRRREFVVGGWSPGKAGREGSIGSLAVGTYDVSLAEAASEGRAPVLHYVGQVGSGLSEDLLRDLTRAFLRLARADSPFAQRAPLPLNFVEPLLVVEVAFTGVTDAGTLRQPSLKGVRSDLSPEDVVFDAEFGGR